jgi:hypothetical protein
MSARWYMITRDGAATLCVDEADAGETAADADAMWPRKGPHRAVQLVEISAVAEALRADAARLDWLQSLTKREATSDMHMHPHGVSLYVRTGVGSQCEAIGDGNVRAAIDAARSKP